MEAAPAASTSRRVVRTLCLGMVRHPSTLLAGLATLALLPGCGDAAPPSSAPAATPPAARLTTAGDRIVLRGDVAPDSFGPLELRGAYRVRFRQRGTGVDFGAEVPFTAHLEQARGAGAPRVLPLFERAAATGATEVTARGRWQLVVDFGDSPFEVELSPRG